MEIRGITVVWVEVLKELVLEEGAGRGKGGGV
jgi:hypothetical protein